MQPTLILVLASIASFTVGILILLCLFLLCRKYKSNRPIHRNRDLDHSAVDIDESASFDPSLRFSMAELRSATNNFSNNLVVGDGAFGVVYKARLSSGATVAIKKLDRDAFQGFREFRAEMETLGKLRHPNIVKILGYCVSGSDRLLIYEFLERGSLDNCLYEASTAEETAAAAADHDSDGYLPLRQPLPWETRLKIMRGVANGLLYLHGLAQPIIHRDIKAGNVLLDSQFEAHIADFGLARMIESSCSHVSTQFAGTWGYMPPEYREGVTAATVKADVYSFGILMFEVAMGRRPNLPMVLDDREVGLIEWARVLVAQNRHMEMVDASISKEELMDGNVKEYFRIACLCTSEKSKERPPMSKVLESLDRICDVELRNDDEYQNKLDIVV